MSTWDDVLIVDCQTTGATPDRGEVLELAWCRLRASESAQSEALLVAVKEGSLSPVVRRLTGLRPEDLLHAVPPEQAWCQLLEAASGTSFAVAHAATFEKRFFADLHRRFGRASPFPFRFVCTHRLAKRLWPELARYSLRATAGFLGHATDMERRAAGHVSATLQVWLHVRRELEARGINSFVALEAFEQTPIPRKTRGVRAGAWPMPRSARLGLPDRPGVYRFLRSDGSLLYIGKATSLRARVNAHFRGRKSMSERTMELLTQAQKLETTETESALEAALLENEEIKKCSPPYNRALVEGAIEFLDSDLRSTGPCAVNESRFGPVRVSSSLPSVGVLQRALKHYSDVPSPEVASQVAGIALTEGAVSRYAPDPEVARRAFALFRRRHSFGKPPTVHELLAVGRTLYLRRGGLRELEEEVEFQLELQNSGWSVESLCDAFDDLLVRAGHALRRGRWLSLLSESTVMFESERGTTRWIAIDAGRIVACGSGKEMPPRLPLRPASVRWTCFSLETYDRLRVLWTELRRTLRSGRAVRVCLSGGRTPDEEGLKRALFWA